MAPSQTLKWLEGGQGPSEQNVEIEGTEPYIVGGHTASGYWVDNGRATTIKGLYAAGDVCGGAPQKYVTGALVEGKIAAESMIAFLENGQQTAEKDAAAQTLLDSYETYFSNPPSLITIEQVEETMQKIMDTYAGGIGSSYQFNETGLALAKEKITALFPVLLALHAEDMDDLLQIYEIRERLTVCLTLIEHLLARKETRWHSFAENMNYREESGAFEKYVNSVKEDGKTRMIFRELVTDDYEPLTFRFDGDNRVTCEGGKKK
jgi:adenylylsulfate reductase subunit A